MFHVPGIWLWKVKEKQIVSNVEIIIKFLVNIFLRSFTCFTADFLKIKNPEFKMYVNFNKNVNKVQTLESRVYFMLMNDLWLNMN